MSGTWKVEPCALADSDALARNNASSFWGQPYWRILWPTDLELEFMISQFRERIPALVLLRDRDVLRHEKAVDSRTGSIGGYARWALPEERCKDSAGRPEWPESQIKEVDLAVGKALHERAMNAWWEPRGDMGELDEKIDDERDRILKTELIGPFIELEYLAVHPDYQKQGIASLLVRNGIQQAERMSLPIFLMAFDISRGLYLRLGFREISNVLQDDSKFGGSGKYNAYFLVYEPVSSS